MKNKGITQSIFLLSAVLIGFVSPGAIADPLGQTREILFECPVGENGCEQSEIKQKAAELNTPAAMYEYVRNTHEYALYHGSRSNTINTFLGRRGSDVDIASVLIAMYRSQGLPARYAVGKVAAPASEVANWLGVKNVELAASIMDDQGIQQVELITDGDRQTIEFEHVWVQVLLPFDDYRGAASPAVDCISATDRCRWIDLDPSWKQRRFNPQAIDLYGDTGFTGFDYERYYNAIKNNDPEYRDKNPLEIYEEAMLAYLKTQYPGKTLEDVADSGVIIPASDGILPASLPYRVTGTYEAFDSIQAHDDVHDPKWAKFLTIHYSLGAFSFTDGLIGPFLLSSSTNPIALADLSTKRITLSYFEGNRISGHLYEHHQMALRLDGEIIHRPILIAWQNDQADYIGRPFHITFRMDGAPSTTSGDSGSTIEASYNNLLFGGYYVIGTGGDTTNWSQVHRSANQLLSANNAFPIVNDSNGIPYIDANDNGTIDNGERRLLDDPVAQDQLTGGLLNVAMSLYYTKFVENTRRLDALNHVISPLEGFVGIVSSTYDVEYLDTTAYSVMPGGLLIDMKGLSINGSWRTDAVSDFSNTHFELLGHEASSLEHEIWQELTGFDAVSTVRGIQMALVGDTTLQTPMNSGSGNNMADQYEGFQFSDTTPAGFSYTPFTVFSTRPATWAHANSG